MRRSDFPIFKKEKALVYLDSGATSLKPQKVIDAVLEYYRDYSANVFRGIYPLSEKASAAYEAVRVKTAKLLNAYSEKEIIFVRNTTEAINLVAYSWARLNVNAGEAIVTTIMEHHSNFVTWQQFCFTNGAVFKVLDIDENGFLNIDEKTIRPIVRDARLVSLVHVSNVLGTINPLKKIITWIKKANPSCLVLVDGAQAVPHLKVDVRDLGCDFYVFSAHKMLGPTGVGVLWAKEKILEKMSPFNYGGDMIESVKIAETTFAELPHRFEAGTPHIAGVIGLGAAIDYLQPVGFEKIRQHEIAITDYALKELRALGNVHIYGPKRAQDRGGVIAFNIFNQHGRLIHPHDVAQILAEDNICIRAGHHCAMPLHERLAIPASARASFYLYSEKSDVDALIKGLKKTWTAFTGK